MGKQVTRRRFIHQAMIAGIGVTAIAAADRSSAIKSGMKLGLVTYQWGKDWDLDTLIANCKKTNLPGVELRTQHAHGVEAALSAGQRAAVKKKFRQSGITCVGYGSNFEFHSPDPRELRQNIEQTKIYIQLCKDIGASGIKVKPNSLPDDVPAEKTIAQIAASLNEVGKFALDFEQQVRVEVHGHRTPELHNMKAIFDQVTEPNVRVCWNSNPDDLLPPGFDQNFDMVKTKLGNTIHVRDLGSKEYPYERLIQRLAEMKYEGWLLLEESSEPSDKVAAMREQLRLFNDLVARTGR